MIKNKFIRAITVIFLILLITKYFLKPMSYGKKIFSGHTTTWMEIYRLEQLDLAVKSMHIPPRWAQDFTGGYGTAFFNYYPPLFMYVEEIFVLMGFPFLSSFKLSIIIFTILSELGIFMLSRELFDFKTAFITTALYLFMPYHIADLYIRGAFAEYTTIALIPFLTYTGILYIKSQNRKWFIIFIFSIFFFLLSHPAIILFYLPTSFIFLSIYWIYSKKKLPFVLFLPYLLAILMAAFYLLPALGEQKYVHINKLKTGYNLAAHHLVYLSQFFHRGWSFGLSVFGPEDKFPFTLGLFYVFSFLISILLFFIKFKEVPSKYKLLFFCSLFFFSLYFYLISIYSMVIWQKISIIQFIQFPWRLFVILDFFMILIISIGFFLVEKLILKESKSGYAILVLIAFICLYFVSNQRLKAKSYLFIPDTREYHCEDVIFSFESTTSGNEYLPISVRKIPEKFALSRIEFLEGKGDIKITENKTQYIKAKIICESKTNIIAFNIFYFPNWTIKLNGRTVKFDIDKTYGIMKLKLSRGNYEVEVLLRNTLLRTLANIISLITLIGVPSIISIVKFRPY